MSLPFQLTIHDHKSGTDYVYEDSRLLAERVGTKEEVQGLDVDLKNLPLSIGPSSSGSNELIGITDPLQLPEGTYRAKLERPGGQIIMDGAVAMKDVIYESVTNTWLIQLINEAPKDFWSLMSDSFIEDPRGNIPITFVQAYALKEGYLLKEEGVYQKAREVLTYILDSESITYDLPDPLFTYQAEYKNATVTHDSSNLLMDFALHERKLIVEAITNYCGFRVMPSYQSFPSLDLHVEFQPTDWPSPAASDTLDGTEEQAGVKQKIEANEDNWGLTLQNGADTTSPDPRSRSYKEPPGSLSASDTAVAAFASPPVYGSVPHEQWRAEPPRGDTNPDYPRQTAFTDRRNVLGDLQSVNVRARAVHPKKAVKGSDEITVYGPVRQPLRDAAPPTTVRFVEAIDDPDGNTYAVHSRHPVASEFDNANPTLAHAPTWTSAPYQNQSQRRTSFREVDGPFVDAADLQVGDATALYDYQGKKWVGWEQRRDLDSTVSELILRHPITVDRYGDLPQLPGSADWVVLQPRGEYRTIKRGNGKEDWLLLFWERTATRHARELWYEVQYIDNRESNPSWTNIGQLDSGPDLDRVFSTALCHQFKTAGNGGDSPSNGEIEARVRPVVGQGLTGAWVKMEVNKK